MKTFKELAKEKFERGRVEHGDQWDAEHIDVKAEMEGELCDLYNYGEIYPDRILGGYIRYLAEDVFKKLNQKRIHVSPEQCESCT